MGEEAVLLFELSSYCIYSQKVEKRMAPGWRVTLMIHSAFPIQCSWRKTGWEEAISLIDWATFTTLCKFMQAKTKKSSCHTRWHTSCQNTFGSVSIEVRKNLATHAKSTQALNKVNMLTRFLEHCISVKILQAIWMPRNVQMSTISTTVPLMRTGFSLPPLSSLDQQPTLLSCRF